MFCSTIVPTVGRPSVARAVQSVLDQSLPSGDFEIIVVNSSGQPLPAGDWQASPRVRQINAARRGQSVARNTGAAIARGQYLHFLDDDDWLLPDAWTVFWDLRQRSPKADWLQGGLRLVDYDGTALREFNPGLKGNTFTQLVAGVWMVPIAALIRAEAFFAVGGYDPQLFVCEEIDLGRQVTRFGDVAHTPAVIACVLHGTEVPRSKSWVSGSCAVGAGGVSTAAGLGRHSVLARPRPAGLPGRRPLELEAQAVCRQRQPRGLWRCQPFAGWAVAAVGRLLAGRAG
jgi:GT2 family glycosyltransferase